MVSVTTTTIKAFIEVLMNEEQPLGGKNMLIRDLKNGLKVQKLTAQKDFLSVCARKSVFPSDISSLARTLSNGDNSKFKKEAKRILRNRTSDKLRDIRQGKETWNRSTEQCRDTLTLSSNG